MCKQESSENNRKREIQKNATTNDLKASSTLK